MSALPPLTRHFFGRFFDNELVAAGTEMHVTVTKILALVAVPGLLLPLFRHTIYLDLAYGQAPAAVRDAVVWFDRSFFIVFAMLVMGVATVLEWDALFPDRRDFAALVPLPIRLRTLFAAKVLSLALFVVLFTAAVNLGSTLLFPMAMGAAVPTPLLQRIYAHAVGVFGASAFVFCFFVALEGVLLNLLSPRWFRRASVYAQSLAVVALLVMFFFFPRIASSLVMLRKTGAPLLHAYPPLWFLGLYETAAGSGDAIFHDLARWALGALALSGGVAALSYAVCYRRHVRRTMETLEGEVAAPSWMQPLISTAVGRVARHPLERAVVSFAAKTMARSARHRVFLAAYVGVGFAFVLQALVETQRDWLSMPLTLLFFVLSGMRFIFTIPAELPGNWIFRLTETQDRGRALEGARKTMLACGAAPLVAGFAPLYFVIWPAVTAALHLLFTAVMAVLLVECLLIGFQKIPFTCSYPPGRANVTLLWVFYWAAFTTYANAMAGLEQWMLRRPLRLVVFYTLAAVAFAVLRNLARRRAEFDLIFDDKPDPVVRTLGLSEFTAGLAAPAGCVSKVR